GATTEIQRSSIIGATRSSATAAARRDTSRGTASEAGDTGTHDSRVMSVRETIPKENRAVARECDKEEQRWRDNRRDRGSTWCPTTRTLDSLSPRGCARPLEW